MKHIEVHDVMLLPSMNGKVFIGPTTVLSLRVTTYIAQDTDSAIDIATKFRIPLDNLIISE